MKYFYLLLSVAFLLVSCKNDKKNSNSATSEQSEAIKHAPQLTLNSNDRGENLIKKLVAKTGSNRRESATVGFVMNDEHYKINRNCGQFEFERKSLNAQKDTVVLKMDNVELKKYVNGKTQNLSTEKREDLAENLRSTVFLAELPFGLNASTVRKKFISPDTLHGKKYEKIRIQFIQEADEQAVRQNYILWIDQDNQLAHLATRVEGDETGLKFMSFQNERKIQGIQFADAVVYQSENKSVDLAAVSKAFNKNRLKKVRTDKLSGIEVTLHEKKCD